MSNTGKKLARGSSLQLLNMLAMAATSATLMPFIVHRVGDQHYGLWSLVGTLIGYYGLLDFGVSSAVTRHLSRALASTDERESNRVFNTAIRIYMAIAVASLAAGIIIASAIGWLKIDPADNDLLRKLVLICSAAVGLSFPLRVYTGALNANLRYDHAAMLDLIMLAIRTGGTLMVISAGGGVLGLAWVSMGAVLPVLLLAISLTRRELPHLCFRYGGFNPATARALFSYGAYALVAQAADILRFQLSPLMVGSFVGVAAVTHYRVADMMIQYFIGTVRCVTGNLQPVFSRQEARSDFQSIRTTFLFLTKISVCASSFIGFGLIAWGKPFIIRWIGPAYLDAYPCIIVLTVGCCATLWQTPSVGLLYGVSQHRAYAAINWIEAVLNIALNVLLAPMYGILGVALGTALPMLAVKLLLQPLYVCRVAQVPFVQYAKLVLRGAATTAAGLLLPALLSVRYARPNYVTLFVLGASSAFCYGLVQWFLLFSTAERAMLRASARRPVG